MSIPGTPSTTGGTSLGSTVTSLFKRMMLEAMIPQFRFYTHAMKSPVPTGQGQAVVWNREVTLAPGYKATEGYPMSAVKTLSTNQVSALLETLGDVVSLSERAFLTSSVDTDAYAIRTISTQARDTIERYIIHNLVADTVAPHYVKKAGAVLNSNSTAVSAGASATALAMSDLQTAETRLEGLNAPQYDKSGYLGIIHPFAKADVVADSDFETWNAYTSPEHMYDHEVGRAYNTRFIQSTLVPISVGSTDSTDMSGGAGYSSMVVATTLFGKDAYGVTELDGGLQTFSDSNPSKADPNNLTRVYSWKANLACKVLNPSALVFVWSDYGSQMTNVSSVSARLAAGITCDTNQIGSW